MPPPTNFQGNPAFPTASPKPFTVPLLKLEWNPREGFTRKALTLAPINGPVSKIITTAQLTLQLGSEIKPKNELEFKANLATIMSDLLYGPQMPIKGSIPKEGVPAPEITYIHHFADEHFDVALKFDPTNYGIGASFKANRILNLFDIGYGYEVPMVGTGALLGKKPEIENTLILNIGTGNFKAGFQLKGEGYYPDPKDKKGSFQGTLQYIW